MSLFSLVGAVTPLAKVLLKGLELVDPKTRDWVNKRKALEWGEKYILADKELQHLNDKTNKTKKELRRIKYLLKRKRFLGKWFFDYD